MATSTKLTEVQVLGGVQGEKKGLARVSLRYWCLDKITSIGAAGRRVKSFNDPELDRRIKELQDYLYEQNYGMLRYIAIEKQERLRSYGLLRVS